MTAPIAAPLLRIPPFPNAAGRSLAQPDRDAGFRLSDEEVDRIAAALAEAKVGGTYWASQPPIPDIPYTLVHLRDPDVRAEAITSLRGERPIVSWAESAPKITPRGPPELHHVSGMLDPWHLISGAADVIVDSDDELALLAALAGIAVTCIGSGRFASLGSGGIPAVRDALRRCAVHGLRYTDPFTGVAVEVTEAIELCGFWRNLIESNRDITAAVGFAFWKRPTVAPLLWGGTSPVSFVSKPMPTTKGQQIAIWKTRTDPATIG